MKLERIIEEANRFTSVAAYREDQMEELYNQAMSLKPKSTIVEIGVEYGRSSFLLAQVAKQKDLNLFLIDNFEQDNGEEAKACVEKWRLDYDLIPVARLIVNSSLDATLPVKKIDMLHIDGDHTAEGVRNDMFTWIPMVKKGGVVCFHDYGHDSLPEVYPTVNKYAKELKIKYSHTTYTTGVFKKI